MKKFKSIFTAFISLTLVLGINTLAAPAAAPVVESIENEYSMASLFEDTAVEPHTHKICGVSSCTDEKHTGHETDIIYTPITQASTVDGVTVTISGTSYKFTLTAGTADAPKTYNFYVDEDITVASAITVPSYTTLNLCLNGKVINCNSYDFLLTTSSGNTDINLCDCSEGVIHHGYLGELGTTGRLIWMQGEEVPEGYTELDLEGGVIDGYDTSTTSSSYSNKALVNLAALTSEDTPVTFNMYGGNLAGHYRYGVYACKYTTFNFHDGRIAGNRMGIVTSTTSNVGTTVNMYGGVVSHHIGDSYCGAAVTSESTFNLYDGEICYNENHSTATNRGAGINNYGIINMYGGSLHHNYSATDGGAVYNNGDINMYGGSMTHNSAYMGAAVYNYGGSSNGGFYMSGGTITQNISLSKNNFSRGAIWLRPGDPSTMFGGGGTFVVSGKPVVYDNFDALGRQANIFVGTSEWQGKTRISVGALEEGAKLGVFAYDTDGPVTYNWSQSMADADPNDYFLSDENPEYNKILVDEASGEVYIDVCEHDGEKVYEGTTDSFHLVTCGICKDVFDQDHTETTPADCLNLAYCEVCDTSYGSVSASNHHESCTVSYTYENGSYHTVSWDKCEYTSRARHTKTTAANCSNPNYCGVCKSNYGSIVKGGHVEDENHACSICKKTACATVLLDGETEPTSFIELNAAFDAVEGKATITLLRDIDELLSGCYVNDGDDITLDFNGHNITLESSYYFNVTKSKKTDYDFARLTVIGSGKITYNKAGSKSYVYSPFLVSAQQNSAGTGAGYPELIIGGDIIVETTGDYAAAVKVESNNPAVTSHFTLKDNAKLISNYANGTVHYSEPASAGIQGGINIFIEGGSLVNNAGTTLVGYNESSNYYDGSLATVYVDVRGIVSNIPKTYYLVSPDFGEKYGTVGFTSGNTVVNQKNYALENTAVSFTVTPSERFTLTSVSANDTELVAADGVYSFTMPAGIVTVTATFNEVVNVVASVTTADGTTTTEYTSIADALTAASSLENCTVKLLDNISATSYETIEGGKFTIDLNGKTWQSTTELIIIRNNAEIKIYDSSENADGMITTEYYSAIGIVDAAKLEIQSGNFSCTGVRIIDASNNGNETSCVVLISGGRFVGSCAVSVAGSNVTLTGGEFECSWGYPFEYLYGTLDLSNYKGTSQMGFYVPDYVDASALELILPDGAIIKKFVNGEIVTELSEGVEFIIEFPEISAIQIDLGSREAETNIRYSEIGGVVSEVVEDGDKYFVEIGEENLLIEFVEKTSNGVFVKSQYFYVDMTEGKATKLNLDSYMTTDGKKSIRTQTPMGIRFRADITDAAREENSAFVIDEYGYIIALEEHLAGTELTFDFSKYVTGVAYNKAAGTDVKYAQENGITTFTGVLYGIPVANYKTNIVSKTYTMITVNGEQFILYGEAVTGNVYDTAQALLSKEDIDEETRSKLSQIILDYDNELGIPADGLYPEA